MGAWRGIRVALAAALLGIGLVVAAVPAAACSCASTSLRERLWSADVAFVGEEVGRQPVEAAEPGDPALALTMSVDEPLRGDLGAEVELLTWGPGDSCSMDEPLDGVVGVVAWRGPQGRLMIGPCGSVVDADQLRAAALPLPPVAGVAEVVVGGIQGAVQGSARVLALAEDGSVVGRGLGAGRVSRLAPCPGGEVVVETGRSTSAPGGAWVAARRLEDMALAGPEIVVSAGEGTTLDAACLAPSGDRSVLGTIGPDAHGADELQLVAIEGVTATTMGLAEGRFVALDAERAIAWTVEGAHGTSVRRRDLTTGAPLPGGWQAPPGREVAHVAVDVVGGRAVVAVGPAGLDPFGYIPVDQLVVFDAEGAVVVEVALPDRSAPQLVWRGDEIVVAASTSQEHRPQRSVVGLDGTVRIEAEGGTVDRLPVVLGNEMMVEDISDASAWPPAPATLRFTPRQGDAYDVVLDATWPLVIAGLPGPAPAASGELAFDASSPTTTTAPPPTAASPTPLPASATPSTTAATALAAPAHTIDEVAANPLASAQGKDDGPWAAVAVTLVAVALVGAALIVVRSRQSR